MEPISTASRPLRQPEPDIGGNQLENTTEAAQSEQAGKSKAPEAASAAKTSAGSAGEPHSEMTAGACELVKRHRPKDLSGFLENARSRNPIESSVDDGDHIIFETRQDGSDATRTMPNSAVAQCNDGYSYCNAAGDIVKHTLDQESILLEQYGRQFDTRNFKVPPPVEEERPRGTISVGMSADGCVSTACFSLGAEVTADRNGKVATALVVGGGVTTATDMGLNATLSGSVKVTDAETAQQASQGNEVAKGFQVGTVGVREVEGEGYRGIEVSQSSSPSLSVDVRGTRSLPTLIGRH